MWSLNYTKISPIFKEQIYKIVVKIINHKKIKALFIKSFKRLKKQKEFDWKQSKVIEWNLKFMNHFQSQPALEKK